MDREWVGKEIVHVAEMPLSVNGKSTIRLLDRELSIFQLAD